MRIYCKACGGKARISSRNELSPLFTNLYCSCLDARCGHTFVMQLSFSHSLRPAGGEVDQMLFDRLQELPRQQQREIFERLGVAPQAGVAGG
ncbi:TPA: ogr/Delta-like zinc finger family protein [Pseudomonas aeruginosa]